MALLDLEQVEERPETIYSSFLCSFSQNNSSFALTRWRRTDYFGSHPKLSVAIKTLVRERCGLEIERIEMLTNLSFFGVYNFNPVSIYYCYVKEILVAAVLEVSNTPWLDKRMYVLRFDSSEPNGYRICWEKEIHVSPFMDVSHYYDWILRPLENGGEKLTIEAISRRKAIDQPLVPWNTPHINGGEAIVQVQSEEVKSLPTSFIVKLNLKRVPWEKAWKTILGNPVMPLAAVLWIHVEAFKVWFRGVPYVLPPLRSRILEAKDAFVHLIVFAIAAFVRYGILLPTELLRNLLRKILLKIGMPLSE